MRHTNILYCLMICTASVVAHQLPQPSYSVPFEQRGAGLMYSLNINNQAVDMTSFLKNITPLMPSPLAAPENNTFTQAAKNWCKKHPFKLMLGCCGFAYGALCIHIMRLEYQLRQGYWYTWKANVDFETLLIMSRTDLMQELLVCMNQRYAKPEATATPLVFMAALNALTHEICIVEQLQYTGQWLSSLKIAALFPFMRTAQLCGDTKRRLLYLRQLMLDAYSAHYSDVNKEGMQTQA